MKKLMIGFFSVFFAMQALYGSIAEEYVVYKHGGTELEGFLAYDSSIKGKMPVVIIVHQWMGLSENEKMRARMFASLGYAAFAADIYGKGIRPQNRDEASKQAGIYRADRKLFRERVRAAADKARGYRFVDRAKAAAVGYCFGGTAVLELARSGYDLGAVVSFHGNIDTPEPENTGSIKAKVLVHNGALDRAVSSEHIAGFEEEMNKAKADWHFINYSGAVHSFTQKEAGSDITTNSAYNENADRRSWEYTKIFLEESFTRR
ncbi:MAG TPA: dienelactone hydrolase family protein [bacterium]|nr:dienelactone hydrolase family protein [bacterium]